ncbi:MAG: hypothetical protein AABY14_00300, partial [Nanoarchaeota archaeon]
DKLDKMSVEKCDTFFIDKEPPKILKETKNLTDLSGNPIKNIATGKSLKVKFSVDIEGLDIDEKSVIANLSDLADGLKAKAPTQTIINKENNAIRTYVWEFELNIKSEGTKKVSVSVSDVFGNKLQPPEVIELSLSKDDDGPVVKSITSGKFFDNVYYATSQETFTVEIEDATGINQNDIILHIDSQGFKAGECKGEKLFTCKFPVNLQGFSEGEVSAFIDTDSKDILGNAVKEKKEIKFIVDKTSPILDEDDSKQKKIYIFKDNAVSEEDAKLIKFGDKVVISIFVLDKNSVSATSDLTSIIRNAVNVDIPCNIAKSPPDSWICEVETNAIDITGKKEREMKMLLEDKAGNKNEFPAEFNVFPIEEKSEEKFFYLNIITEKLRHIDYSILTTMARETYPLIIPFNLRENGNCKGKPEVFNARLKCDEIKGNLRNLVKKGDIYGGYIQFEITPDIVGSKEQLSIGETNSCIIEYTTKCGDVVYKTPEQQNIRVNIYVNRDDISAEDAVIRDIEEIKEKVNSNLQKTINFLDKTFTFAQNVCSTKQGFVVAINAINIMGNIFARCKDSAVLDAFTKGSCVKAEPALAKLHGVSQKVVDTLSANWIDAMCGYASCTSSKASVPTGVLKPSGDSKLSVGYLSGQHCDKLKDELLKSDVGAFFKAGTQSTLELSKKNWFVAGGCGCIPGLLANLQKYRQIECDKAVCLRDVVPIGARTVNDCNREHGINQCTYILGGFGGVVIDVLTAPFKGIVSSLSHPIASSYVIARQSLVKRCETNCPIGGCTAKWVSSCSLAGTMLALEHLAQFTDVLRSLDDLTNFKASIQPDYCEILNKDDTKQKTQQESSSQDTTQRLSLPHSQNQPTQASTSQ